MKSVIILGDGMADYKIEELGNKTPLMAAKKPNMDKIASLGEIGLAKTVPDGMKPGSDNANLAVMGYNPKECYTGRSPLEAVSIGIELKSDDVTFRCNLVSLSEEEPYEQKTMVDYSSDEISTEEARALVEALKPLVNDEKRQLFAGFSYRHCLRYNGYTGKIELTPPHNITTRKITDYLPCGDEAEYFLNLQKKSFDILNNHPVNLARQERGLKKANSMWLWGMGTKPKLDNFEKKFGRRAAVISAVDLIKGIGMLAGMEIINVAGATGNINTDFSGKGLAAIEAMKRGVEFVYVHVEAPDECGHRHELDNKIKAIELIDENIVGPIYEYLKKSGEDFSIGILPDHPTPIALRTHVSDPVPFIVYKSYDEKRCGCVYDEDTAARSGLFFEDGYKLLPYILK